VALWIVAPVGNVRLNRNKTRSEFCEMVSDFAEPKFLYGESVDR
jgi:hypothetical protein